MGCYPRFDYGTIIPHIALQGSHCGFAHGGADGLSVFCSASMWAIADDGFRADGELAAGEQVTAAVTYQSRSITNPTELSEQGVRDRLREKGIRVRYLDTPVLRNCLRFSVGKPEHTDRLLEALTEIGAHVGR